MSVENQKKNIRTDEVEKILLFDVNKDEIECFGYYYWDKTDGTGYKFTVTEVFLSEEFRTEISMRLDTSQFEDRDFEIEDFRNYLLMNIKENKYVLDEPGKIWEKYTCRYQSKVDESGKYVPKYSDEELLVIEQEEYLTPIEWTNRFCNWKRIEGRKFNVQTYDD